MLLKQIAENTVPFIISVIPEPYEKQSLLLRSRLYQLQVNFTTHNNQDIQLLELVMIRHPQKTYRHLAIEALTFSTNSTAKQALQKALELYKENIQERISANTELLDIVMGLVVQGERKTTRLSFELKPQQAILINLGSTTAPK